MFQLPKTTQHPNRIDAGIADRHRDAMARRSRNAYSAVSDIGTIPPVKDPERRAYCAESLRRFLKIYFPHSTGQGEFSDEQNRAIDRIQFSAQDSGLFQSLFPRGFAKSTISENSAIGILLYGWRRFISIFGASGDAASLMIDSIKLELSENDLLLEDFPEVCYPIRKLEGKPQRCMSQHHGGRLTHIEWTADKLVLPMIEGSVAGGGVVVARGIDAATRGMKHKLPNGEQLRPDFFIIDDPQTDESARSEVQTNKRIDVIRKNILKLGGHKRKIAGVMNATVIRPGDMVEQVADQKKFPAWQTERIKMVKKWADAHETLWLEQYARIRNTFDPLLPGDQKRAHREATDFYRKNRAAMDAGCLVTWAQCFEPDKETSAIQHAYNLLIDDGPEVFASECQNEPLADVTESEGLKPEQILVPERFNRVPLGTVPLQYGRLVGHIDVQGNVLFWSVLALDDHFGAAVVDFGTWPKVDRPYFSLADVRKSLRAATGADSDSAAVRIAVQRCSAELAERDWRNTDGLAVQLERIGVDAQWGPFVDEVYQACRESEHAAKLVPTHGKFYGAKSERRIEDTKPGPADRSGMGWRLIRTAAKTKRAIAYLLIDANRWKTFAEKRLMTTPGSPGSIMLNGKPGADGRVPERYRLLADHYTAERCIMVEALGRTAPEWSLKRRGRDNHWWDNLYNCFVLGAVQGVREPTAAPPREKKKVKFSEVLAKKRANGGGWLKKRNAL